MVRFEQIACGSDCTGPYKVDISLPMTVKEFVDEILTNYKSEWGYIGIYKKGVLFGYPRCQYKYGKLLCSLPEEYLDKQIEKVSGSGGWSNSDFILHLANDVVETSPKDQYNADITDIPTRKDTYTKEEVIDMLKEVRKQLKDMRTNFYDRGHKAVSFGINIGMEEVQRKIDALEE